MAARPRQIHFNVHVSTGGNHEAAWRHPKSDPVHLASFAYQKKIAAIAERGKLDVLFYSIRLRCRVMLLCVQWSNSIRLRSMVH